MLSDIILDHSSRFRKDAAALSPSSGIKGGQASWLDTRGVGSVYAVQPGGGKVGPGGLDQQPCRNREEQGEKRIET
jgi:hypothetical protein